MTPGQHEVDRHRARRRVGPDVEGRLRDSRLHGRLGAENDADRESLGPVFTLGDLERVRFADLEESRVHPGGPIGQDDEDGQALDLPGVGDEGDLVGPGLWYGGGQRDHEF